MNDAALSQSRPLLFTPMTIRGITLPNRTVLAPMVQYRSTHGAPGDFHLVHLGKFALGRFGIVMAEATAVEARGRVSHGCPGIWSDDHIQAWKRITSYIKAEGSVPALQLAHAGRKAATHRAQEGTAPYTAEDAKRGLPAWDVVGPTKEPTAPGHHVPHALSVSEVQDLVQAFADAARRADAAGVANVEIHGAHWYLLVSLLSPISNNRHDPDGGDRPARVRFPLVGRRAGRAG